MKSWGFHLIVNISNCKKKYITDKEQIRKFMSELIQKIKMIPLSEAVIVESHYGGPKMYGISAIQLIRTSSISCHFVEYNKSGYIDIFSCKEFNIGKTIKIIKKSLKNTLNQKK